MTRALAALPTGQSICYDDGKAAIPAGYFAPSDDDYWTGSLGSLLVNLTDMIGTEYHPSLTRNQGCCGRDGTHGPNVVCRAGHEIGTERSDCWMAHAVVLLPTIVRSAAGDSS